MKLLGLCITLAILSCVTANYCKPALCPNGKKHVACTTAWATTCPAKRNLVNLKPNQAQILQIHNHWRNQLAGGLIGKYTPATRMATMQWDQNLAAIAAFNVKQCAMKHDQCRNTATYKKSGQNLSIFGYTGPIKSKTNKEIIKTGLLSWWKENKNANMAIIKSYPATISGPQIGHFTIFSTDRNDRVGCAAARYTVGQKNNFLLACNYATTNIVGKPVYVSGVKAAAGCKNGTHPTFKNLCGLGEVYVY